MKLENHAIMHQVSLNSQMASNPVVQLVLISLLALVVFSPAIFAEYSLVDDAEIVAALKADQGGLPLRSLFVPNVKEGGYYRPLIGLSQQVDRLVWRMDSRIVHIENIVFHLINAVWVYLLIRLHIPPDRRKISLAPLIASLLFALHPVVTESVNWYSGRTDLIVGSLVLPALCALAVWRSSRRPWLVLAAGGLILLAALAKESALGVLIVLPLFLLSPGTHDDQHSLCRDTWRVYAFFLAPSLAAALFFFKFWPAMILALLCAVVLVIMQNRDSSRDTSVATVRKKLDLTPYLYTVGFFLSACALFYGLRQVAYTGRLPRIRATISLMFQDLDYTIGLFLGGIGFYVKKFFLPIPLNFAIREIDPLYQLGGVIILFIAVALIIKRTYWSLFAVIGILLLAPALPFVFGTIAWTSYAERYMYLSTVFWAGSAALYADERGITTRLKQTLLVLLIVVMASVTCWRSIVWRSNVALLADTVRKTPDFKDIRAFYMLALYLNNDLAGAEAQYHAASMIPAIIYNPKIDIVYARVLYDQGKKDEAYRLLEKVILKTGRKSTDALTTLNELKQRESVGSQAIEGVMIKK